MLILIFKIFILITYSNTRFQIFISEQSQDNYISGKRVFLEAGANLDLRETFSLDSIILFDANFIVNSAMKYEKNEELKTEYAYPSQNKIFGEGIIRYPLGWRADPFFSSSFDSYLIPAITYIQNKQLTIADWRDPITTKQGIGFAYYWRKNKSNMQMRAGYTIKQIRASEYTRTTDDRKTKDIIENYLTEQGIQFNVKSMIYLDSNFTYRGTLDLFNKLENLEVWELKMQNQFQIKVLKAIGFTIDLNLVYVERQKAKLQFDQILRIGISADFKVVGN